METGTIITTLVLIGLSIIPFTLMARGRKKAERQEFEALRNLAQKHSCQLSQHEICGNYGIGIDESNNHLFYHERTKDAIIEEFIDLATISKCEVNKTTRTLDNGKDTLIDRLELSFRPIQSNKPIVLLEFFNIETSSHLNGELQIAEKWANLVNAHLRSEN